MSTFSTSTSLRARNLDMRIAFAIRPYGPVVVPLRLQDSEMRRGPGPSAPGLEVHHIEAWSGEESLRCFCCRESSSQKFSFCHITGR